MMRQSKTQVQNRLATDGQKGIASRNGVMVCHKAKSCTKEDVLKIEKSNAQILDGFVCMISKGISFSIWKKKKAAVWQPSVTILPIPLDNTLCQILLPTQPPS
jgi:hypothetical protein